MSQWLYMRLKHANTGWRLVVIQWNGTVEDAAVSWWTLTTQPEPVLSFAWDGGCLNQPAACLPPPLGLHPSELEAGNRTDPASACRDTLHPVQREAFSSGRCTSAELSSLWMRAVDPEQGEATSRSHWLQTMIMDAAALLWNLIWWRGAGSFSHTLKVRPETIAITTAGGHSTWNVSATQRPSDGIPAHSFQSQHLLHLKTLHSLHLDPYMEVCSSNMSSDSRSADLFNLAHNFFCRNIKKQ